MFYISEGLKFCMGMKIGGCLNVAALWPTLVDNQSLISSYLVLLVELCW